MININDFAFKFATFSLQNITDLDGKIQTASLAAIKIREFGSPQAF